MRARANGFTLVELLVVIAIIGVLVGLALPAILKARESANRSRCANHLKQLAIACHAHGDQLGRLPYNQCGGAYGWGPDSRGWSWLARLLPFLEQHSLYSQGGIPSRTLRDSGVADRRIEVFLCPSDTAFHAPPRADAGNLEGFPVGNSNYKGVGGSNWGMDDGAWKPTDWVHQGANGSYDGLADGDGMFFRSDYKRSLRLTDIADGASATLMIGEDIPAENQWISWPYANKAFGTCAIPLNVKKADGTDYPNWDWHNKNSFRSRHPGGVQFAFADGSVRLLDHNISLSLYRGLSTIAGGEAVAPP